MSWFCPLLSSSTVSSPLKGSLLPGLRESLPGHYPLSSGDVFERALTTSPHSLKLLSLPQGLCGLSDLAIYSLQPHFESPFCSHSMDSFQYEFQSLLTSGPLCMVFLLSVQSSLPVLIIPSALIIPRYPSGPASTSGYLLLRPPGNILFPQHPSLCSTQ